jgi:hypothetical protein
MRKIAITLVAMGFACCAKAQSLPVFPKQQPLQKFRFLPDSLSGNNFSFKVDSLKKWGANPVARLNIMANANIDNMPIARLGGSYNMPVVQTDKTAYNMPVVGMRQPQIYMMKKPGDKTVVAPAKNNEIK